VSNTAEAATGVTDPPPGGQAAGGNGILRTLRHGAGAFLRQREATVLVVVVALFLYFTIDSPNFFTHANQANLLSGIAAPYIILATGEVLLTVTLGLPSFIATLGTSFVLYGVVLTTSHGEPVDIPPSAEHIGKFFGNETTSAWGWSAIIWAVALVAVFHVVLTQTRWGLHTVAVGGNQLGAREAGISVARIKFGNFMMTGMLGALVGLQVAFYDNTIDPSAGGYQYMFYAVAAAVLGGTALLGGSGTILGAGLGALVLAVFIDGFAIIGVSANPLLIVFGAGVLVAMIANVQLGKLREAGRT
jgi:simple sugar transport system permease protein